MTDKELEEFIHHGETAFLAFAMMFGEGWAQRAIDIAKELRARLAQPEQEQLMQDIVTYGTAVSQGGKRIDPTNIYKEPEQEPVALNCEYTKQLIEALYENSDPVSVDAANEFERLLTAPPQREWKSLTSAQMKALWVAAEKKPSVFAGMIDGKLKELNHD